MKRKLSLLIKKLGDQEMAESEFKELFGIKTEWKPERNEGYFYITDYGDESFSTWTYHIVDEGRWQFGNVYRTEKEATFARDKKRFLTKMERDFKENSDPINWNSMNQKKYFLEYRPWDGVIRRSFLLKYDHGTPVTTNAEWLDEYILKYSDEIRRYVFGVEL